MNNEVISFDYVLTDREGQVIDASAQGKPLIFITGLGQIIPGLETILVGMEPSQKKTVTVPAKDAYGMHDPSLIYKVGRAKLPRDDVHVGDTFEVGQDGDFRPVTITAIDGDEITLDGNHPLAAQDLTFTVEVVGKRPATAEEVSHGHVHGADGCQH